MAVPTNDLPDFAATHDKVVRTIFVGGKTVSVLLKELALLGIELNDAARILLLDERFVTSMARVPLTTVEVTVGGLGFPDGATMEAIHGKAHCLGLELCPLETGPQFRLQYLEQLEGNAGQLELRHRAPPGSITIMSEVLSGDEDFPQGFYVRRINGTLWLRGYYAGPEHLWSSYDHLLFCQR